MSQPQNPLPQPKPQFHAPKIGDGWLWLSAGFKLFWRNPWALSSAALIFLLLPMFAGALPVLGQGLGLVLLPGLAAGAMYAAFSVSQGAHPLPHTVFAPFLWGPKRQNLPRLRAILILGAAYASAVLLLLKLVFWAGGEPLSELLHMVQNQSQEGQQQLDVAAMQSLLQEVPHLSLLVLASLPVVGILFFIFSRAAMLSFCFQLNPGKALFFSLYSTVKSLPALLLYALSLGVFSALAGQLMLLHPFVYAIGLILFIGVLLCSLWEGFGRSFPPPVLTVRAQRVPPAAATPQPDEPGPAEDKKPHDDERQP